MAHYLLHYPDYEDMSDAAWHIVEADSASQAVRDTVLTEGQIEVWTLRTVEPRVYTVSTETQRTIKQT